MQAVILAAGRGSRLKPLTDNTPKPFVKIIGIDLFHTILDNLIQLGITEVIVAVGYLKEYFYEHVGSEYKTLKISYVEVLDWESVNNSISLYKTKDMVKSGFILIEGDEYFLDQFIPSELLFDEKNYWVATKERETGCLLHADEQGRIVDLQIIRDVSAVDGMNDWYKSCGVVKIADQYRDTFFEKLGAFLSANDTNRNQYYDIFLRQHLGDLPLNLAPLPKGVIWGEIDTIEDIQKLENTIARMQKLGNYMPKDIAV